MAVEMDTSPRISVWNQAGSLVDGGYFENEGLQTALDLADRLAAQSTILGRPVQPIIVQATEDGEADVSPADVMTCANTSDGAFILDDKHSAWQILAPLFGLYHVRGGRSAVLLRQAHDQFCSGRPRFVHFYLPADNGHPIPLNWVLSDPTARFIRTAFTDEQVLNATELGTSMMRWRQTPCRAIWRRATSDAGRATTLASAPLDNLFCIERAMKCCPSRPYCR
jgi:hypothetical protein